MVARIAASAVLLVAAVLIPYEGPWRFVLFLPAYFVIGWDVLWKAARNIAHGQVFDENFLMALATVGAFCTGFFGEGQYPEAVFVMLFYQVGELFQLRRGQIPEIHRQPHGHSPGLRQRGAGRPADPGGPGGSGGGGYHHRESRGARPPGRRGAGGPVHGEHLRPDRGERAPPGAARG